MYMKNIILELNNDIQDDTKNSLKTWDFRGVSREDFKVNFEGYLDGDFKQVRSGLVRF